jgi:hypothetical protein
MDRDNNLVETSSYWREHHHFDPRIFDMSPDEPSLDNWRVDGIATFRWQKGTTWGSQKGVTAIVWLGVVLY